MKKICFFSGDITRSGGTERVSTVIANQLVKDEKLNICFLSLWENNEDMFYQLNDEIKIYESDKKLRIEINLKAKFTKHYEIYGKNGVEHNLILQG